MNPSLLPSQSFSILSEVNSPFPNLVDITLIRFLFRGWPFFVAFIIQTKFTLNIFGKNQHHISLFIIVCSLHYSSNNI